MNNKLALPFLLLISCCLSSCAAHAAIKPLIITLTPKSCIKHGRVIAIHTKPTVQDIAKDAYCTLNFMQKYAPHGTVTVFGSSRTKLRHKNYILAKKFAFLWTKADKDNHPILTGGGPGIMQAANHGAAEAKGYSLYLANHFIHEASINPHATHGYIASSLAQKTSDMVNYSAAIVVLPGGFGTEWELFETLTKIQTHKIKPIPIILLGSKKTWANLTDHIKHLKNIGTISKKDLILYANISNANSAVQYLEKIYHHI
ncbi:MAG: LOG family protein [Gammaproteobacteria bacterium]|nr:LOG family protein [Gammaproteobacteria bacterium]